MDTLNTISVSDWAGTSDRNTGSGERSEVVSRLIGNAFEMARPSDRGMMIDYLIGSVGVLSLTTIASGIFLWRRLGDESANPLMNAAKSVPIDARHMRDLADRIQQIDPQAIDEMVEAFNTPPLSTTSSVGEILADLPLRRARRHLAD